MFKIHLSKNSFVIYKKKFIHYMYLKFQFSFLRHFSLDNSLCTSTSAYGCITRNTAQHLINVNKRIERSGQEI